MALEYEKKRERGLGCGGRCGAETYDLGLGADKLADSLNFLCGEVLHLPVCAGFADVDSKVLEHVGSALGVRDLGVKLDT